jgi:hypothetical protein
MRLYLESLGMMRKVLDAVHVPESLEGLAMLAVETGQPEQAARLFGAAQAFRERMGTPLEPILHPEYDSCVQRLHQTLPQEELERLWEEGRGMAAEEAITEAFKTGEITS